MGYQITSGGWGPERFVEILIRGGYTIRYSRVIKSTEIKSNQIKSFLIIISVIQTKNNGGGGGGEGYTFFFSL